MSAEKCTACFELRGYLCGLNAGHPGMHWCVVDVPALGGPCDFSWDSEVFQAVPKDSAEMVRRAGP